MRLKWWCCCFESEKKRGSKEGELRRRWYLWSSPLLFLLLCHIAQYLLFLPAPFSNGISPIPIGEKRNKSHNLPLSALFGAFEKMFQQLLFLFLQRWGRVEKGEKSWCFSFFSPILNWVPRVHLLWPLFAKKSSANPVFDARRRKGREAPIVPDNLWKEILHCRLRPFAQMQLHHFLPKKERLSPVSTLLVIPRFVSRWAWVSINLGRKKERKKIRETSTNAAEKESSISGDEMPVLFSSESTTKTVKREERGWF